MSKETTGTNLAIMKALGINTSDAIVSINIKLRPEKLPVVFIKKML